jgi:serine/threonine-protein kinase
MDEEKRKAIQGAKVLEKHGRQDAAVQLLKQAAVYDEAARILSGQRRFAEAGELLMNGLGVTLEQVPALNTEGKKLALMAAICFSRAGRSTEAVNLFLALKEHQRAAQVLERAGDRVGAAKVLASAKGRFAPSQQPQGVGGAALTLEAAKRLESQGKIEAAIQAYVQLKRFGDAARVAKDQGRIAEAASFYAEAGMVFEAGSCYVQAGDSGKALENFVRVPRNDDRYRAAANEVARLGAELGHVDLRMDYFLTRFIQEGPLDARDLESFYRLGKLYEKHDLIENAKEVLRKIIANSPGFRDAAQWLEALESQTQVSSAQYQRILKEEAAHLGAVPKLSKSWQGPPLPDLPPLPKPPESAAPRVFSMAPAPARAAEKHVESSVQSDEMLSRAVGEDVERIARELNPSAGGSNESTGNTLFAVGIKPAAIAVEARPEAIGAGSILAERYRLEEQIGQGGMGVVYRATDLELAEEIALKIFKPLNEDEQALARFRQELQLSRQLVHPNVVRLFDIGVYRGCRFISMELLIGSDLKRLLTAPIEIHSGIALLVQACAGLKAAHERGIIHRDIKPENLFITADGVLKVMDFGIAKRQLAKGVTVAGMVAGTPEYISPEQIDNFTAVTAASDLYSLGVVAYEMFTGRLPFQCGELVPLLMMHINNPPPPPRTVNSSIPEPLEALLLKLLAKKPEDRFSDAQALADTLLQVERLL